MNGELAGIAAELTMIEKQVALLVHSADMTEPAAVGGPESSGYGKYQRWVLAALAEVEKQQPGAWVPVHTIADYVTQRELYRSVQQAAQRLVKARRVQCLHVAFDQTRRSLIRQPSEHGQVDVEALAAQANAALALVGHQVTIAPARLISSNFTPVAVAHAGRQLTVYRRDRAWTLTVAST